MTETIRAVERNLRTNPAAAPSAAPPSVVSVVIVNYKGADDTIACLDGLASLEWPAERLEVVVVDNASGDGSVERIRSAHPEVTLLALDANTGFAGGCNEGAAAATGQYLAFINNDARPDPQWLTAAIADLDDHPDVGCVASRVLDWEGRTVDFVDAALSVYGHGFKLHVGEDAGGASTSRVTCSSRPARR
jgi:GT2 family glycosyltransferase